MAFEEEACTNEKTREDAVINSYLQQKENFHQIQPHWHLDLRLPVFRIVINKTVLSKLPSQWCFIMAQTKKQMLKLIITLCLCKITVPILRKYTLKYKVKIFIQVFVYSVIEKPE